MRFIFPKIKVRTPSSVAGRMFVLMPWIIVVGNPGGLGNYFEPRYSLKVLIECKDCIYTIVPAC